MTGRSEKITTSADVEGIKKSALLWSLVAIVSVFAFEFVAGIFTNSLALITDSTHALLDAVVTAILIIAIRLALKPKDIDHTYGHGKIETVGGFIGGIALFVVAVFFIHEAVMRLLYSSSSSMESASVVVVPGTIAFAALIYTLAVDGFRIGILGRAMKKTSAHIAGSTITTTLKADFLHAFADLASTTVAFVGLWLVTTGFQYGDSIAAIILASLLSYLSVRFAYQNAMELTDVISPRLVGSVQQAANETEGVLHSDDIKMRRVGSEIFVEATIALPAQISFESAHDISAKVEGNIAKSLSGAGMRVKPRNITVHFEPVLGTTMPVELLIESAASQVSGVRGVHNVIISKISNSNSIDVSLHIQVNRSATLVKAHSIANAVEESIKRQLASVGNITVHLEPVISDVVGMERIAEGTMHDSIRNILIGGASAVKKIDRIGIYRTAENTFKIDISCSFSSEMTIEQIHDRVSEVEKEIRTNYPGSIVTIHAEPSY
ncbi:MAG TPA: cation diffusion facilitator family transporter [Nitrososphaera sp.]|nr:cation diffusion facilitator family transporter [Nitrososphaera sp.]